MDKQDNASIEGCPSETAQAGKASACEGCPGRELCKEFSKEEEKEIAQTKVRMKPIKRKILILSTKGGVGKSTFCTSLALYLGGQNKKVGIADLDICGPSVSNMIGIENNAKVINSEWGWVPTKSPHCGIKVVSTQQLLENQDEAVIWRGPRKTGLIKRFINDTMWGKLDFLLFDTPPGTSDEHLTVVKILKDVNPDGAIIVTSPQDIALSTTKKEINFCKKQNVKILGIVENLSGFVCPCCQELYDLFPSGSESVKDLAEKQNLTFLGRLPIDKTTTECSEKGHNCFESYPDSPYCQAFSSIVDTLMSVLP